MDIIRTIHRFLGETMLLIALVGVILALVGLVRKKSLTKAEDIFGMVYAGLLDLQALLGIISFVYLLISLGTEVLSAAFILHPVFMIAAVVVVHASRGWRSSPIPIRHRAQLVAYGASLLLIFIGRMLWVI